MQDVVSFDNQGNYTTGASEMDVEAGKVARPTPPPPRARGGKARTTSHNAFDLAALKNRGATSGAEKNDVTSVQTKKDPVPATSAKPPVEDKKPQQRKVSPAKPKQARPRAAAPTTVKTETSVDKKPTTSVKKPEVDSAPANLSSEPKDTINYDHVKGETSMENTVTNTPASAPAVHTEPENPSAEMNLTQDTPQTQDKKSEESVVKTDFGSFNIINLTEMQKKCPWDKVVTYFDSVIKNGIKFPANAFEFEGLQNVKFYGWCNTNTAGAPAITVGVGNDITVVKYDTSKQKVSDLSGNIHIVDNCGMLNGNPVISSYMLMAKVIKL